MSANNQTALMALIGVIVLSLLGVNTDNPWAATILWVMTIICFLFFIGTVEIKRRG